MMTCPAIIIVLLLLIITCMTLPNAVDAELEVANCVLLKYLNCSWRGIVE